MNARDQLRAQILGADDVKRQKIAIPEWNGVELELVEIYGDRRARWEKRIDEVGKTISTPERMAMTVALAAQDPMSGELLFGEEDIPALAQKSIHVLKRLYDAVIELSSVREAGVEAVVGESEAGPS